MTYQDHFPAFEETKRRGWLAYGWKSESKWESNGFERLSKPIEQSNIIGCSSSLLLFLSFIYIYIYYTFTHWFFIFLFLLSSRCFRSTRSSSHQLAFQFGDNLRELKEFVIFSSFEGLSLSNLSCTTNRKTFFFYLANISNSVNSFFFSFSFLLLLVFLSCFLLCNFTITVSYSFDDMKTFRHSSIIHSDIVLPYIALAPPPAANFLALNKSEQIKELMSFTCRLTIEVHIRVSSQGLTGSSPCNGPFCHP